MQTIIKKPKKTFRISIYIFKILFFLSIFYFNTAYTLHNYEIIIDMIDLEEANVITPSPEVVTPLKENILDVPLISQLPELKNGCEIVSLTMALNYRGIDIDKITLSNEVQKDPTELQLSTNGEFLLWGNPKVGFVGDITGKDHGYSIDPEPLIPLIEKYYSGEMTNLCGADLVDLEKALSNNTPILVWINAFFSEDIYWTVWKDSNGNEVTANLNMHAVLLTGFDENNFYYNDPLTYEKDKAVSKDVFLNVWTSMGKKALGI